LVDVGGYCVYFVGFVDVGLGIEVVGGELL